MTFEEIRAFLDRSSATQSSCFHCHESGGCLPQVFVNDDTLYDTLTTKTISRCENRALVSPGDPDNSALYLVLKGTCGTVGKMPAGCLESDDPTQNTCITPAEIERVRLWIAEGAPEE